MVTVKALRTWLQGLGDAELIGVSEDGHAITTAEGVDYYEIGRMPLCFPPSDPDAPDPPDGFVRCQGVDYGCGDPECLDCYEALPTPRPKSPPICSGCGEEGHYRDDCPDRGTDAERAFGVSRSEPEAE